MLTVGTEVVVFPNSAEENLARDSIG